jgi:hypothetical protein
LQIADWEEFLYAIQILISQSAICNLPSAIPQILEKITLNRILKRVWVPPPRRIRPSAGSLAVEGDI